jgi:hypothetical protein
MKTFRVVALVLASAACCFAADQPPASRAERGGPLVTVSHTGAKWVIAGQKQKVILDQATLAMTIEAPPVTWQMAPSEADDILAKSQGEEFNLHLTDAGKLEIVPYDTGFKTGVKVRLSDFHDHGMLHQVAPLDFTLVLTICLEGKAEDLVCTAVAIEHNDVVRQLDWPKEVETRGANYTALNHVRGNLLPVNYPKEYGPFLANVPAGQNQEKFSKAETSYIQSDLIESWSMSWWGFQKGKSALTVIVETPDDAAYKFHHPAGGPTVLGNRWLASLGRFAYPRSVRFCFEAKGDYVTMAKRYRQHVIDNGQFISLKEKIAMQPLVATLIGTPQMHQHALRNYRVGAYRYDTKNPATNYHLVTFDQCAQELRDLKAKGIDRMIVTLAAWPYDGYDRQHPDALPPSPDAGGWAGMKRWCDTCRELGYTYVLHDQYRDYYTDAPSWDPQFAAHEEDNIKPALVFPGTRFGGKKQGYLPLMDYWDGGEMGYLNEGLAIGHMKKNYEALFEHGIHTMGSSLDVFGYVPPTEDFNPEHPITRTAAMKGRAACFIWARRHLGVVGTEAGADWVVPYVDYTSGANEGSVIPAPLYELVYHDAIMTPAGGTGDYLRCLLNGGYPTVPRHLTDPKAMEILKTVCALHKRVALLEMTSHEFLDKNHRKERTTFSDGTTVTVDRDAKSFEIKPELTL